MPRILAITNEDPGWPEADKQQGDDAWQALVSGLAEEGYECRAFKFFDDLRFLDDFDPREWLVWNWGEELAGRPWSDAEVADELERRGFAYTGASARLIRLTQDRMDVKRRLQAAGLPTLPGARPASSGGGPGLDGLPGHRQGRTPARERWHRQRGDCEHGSRARPARGLAPRASWR